MAASSSSLSSSLSSPSSAQEVVALRVPRSLVKTVKTALEAQGLFGRRITRVDDDDDDDGDDGDDDDDDDDTGDNAGSAVKAAEEQEGAKAEEMFTITTTIPAGAGSATLLTTLSLPSAAAALTTTTTTTTTAAPAPAPSAAAPRAKPTRSPPPSPPSSTRCPSPATRAALLATAPTHYTVYPPLLLLPTGTFTHPPWPALLPTLPATFFARLASALNCTHLAINAPIPATSATRTPLALTPLHGAFTTPTLWVRTTQNGIIQTWPPAHCMFSRGNIREKARLLRLPALRGTQVADLYAGIGYFTFSYAAAGAARIWCWEVSAWSAEALCRGARANGWRAELVRCGEEVPGGLEGLDARAVRIVVFVESNACAVGRLRALGVGGVRHVNMGYLPDCRAVWPAAVEMLGGGGGVAHVHGNVKVGAEREYSEGVVGAFAALLGEGDGEGEGGGRVSCEHVEVVKTYAPGVVHCVFDIKIEGRQEQE